MVLLYNAYIKSSLKKGENMNYTELLFSNNCTNGKSKRKQHKSQVIIDLSSDSFNSGSLVRLVREINKLLKYSIMKYDVIINLGNVKFSDEVTFLVFESIVYYLCKRTNFNLRIGITVDYSILQNTIFINSVLQRTFQENQNSQYLNKKMFIELYERSTFIQDNLYRKYIKRSAFKISDNYPSEVWSEIATALLLYLPDVEWNNQVAETISELVDNVQSHTDSDCLIKLKILDVIGDNDEKFFNITVTIMNYCEKRLFDSIKQNFEESKYNKDITPYKEVYAARDNHKKYFDDLYNEDCFYMVSAFQNHVTSRSTTEAHSGTGLTDMIKHITDKTVDDYSYVLSGYNLIFFKNKYLQFTDENFIGFNDTRDFLNNRPDKSIIDKSMLYIPGTVYHLSLIKKETI